MSFNKKRQHRRRRRTQSRSNSPDDQDSKVAKITAKPFKGKKGRNNDNIGNDGSIVATAIIAVSQSSSSNISLCNCLNTCLESNKTKIDMLSSATIDLNGKAQTQNRGEIKCICKCSLYECTITYPDGGIYAGSTKFISLDESQKKDYINENEVSNEKITKNFKLQMDTTNNHTKNKSSIILPIRDGHGVFIDKDQNIHEGLWKNDYANGHGIKEFHTGDRHEGSYVKDKREGWGKYIFINGNQYIGEFCNGLMHGRGTFLWGIKGDMYDGEWKNGKMHGKGTKKMANGDSYEGQFINGIANGWGFKKFSSGDVHEGQYFSDKRCGFGSYIWINGDRYEGGWKDGKMDGRGRKQMANGDIYQGEYKADMAHGYGMKIFACGDIHEGYYRDDLRETYGRYFWPNGDTYEGHFSNGRICGLGIKCMANGDIYDGEFMDDEAHGYGVKTFANGDQHEGEYRYDKRESFGTYCFANGEKYIGMWEQGNQSNIGSYYYLDGSIFEGRWENGKKNGPGYSYQGEDLKKSEQIYFEVWSNDQMMHREEIPKTFRDFIPSIEDLCDERFSKRNQFASKSYSNHYQQSTLDRLRFSIAEQKYDDDDKKNSNERFVIEHVNRWRWVWQSNKRPYDKERRSFWAQRQNVRDILPLSEISFEYDDYFDTLHALTQSKSNENEMEYESSQNASKPLHESHSSLKMNVKVDETSYSHTIDTMSDFDSNEIFVKEESLDVKEKVLNDDDDCDNLDNNDDSSDFLCNVSNDKGKESEVVLDKSNPITKDKLKRVYSNLSQSNHLCIYQRRRSKVHGIRIPKLARKKRQDG